MLKKLTLMLPERLGYTALLLIVIWRWISLKIIRRCYYTLCFVVSHPEPWLCHVDVLAPPVRRKRVMPGSWKVDNGVATQRSASFISVTG